jgi:hypothetical protein
VEHTYTTIVVDTKQQQCHAAYKDNKHETLCHRILLGNDFAEAEPGNGLPMCQACAKTFVEIETE